MVDVFEISSSLVGVDDARMEKVVAPAIGKRAARLGGMPWADALKTEQQTTLDSFEPAEDGGGYRKISDAIGSSESGLVDGAVDGSVVEFYPYFEAYMHEALMAAKESSPEGEE
ncbi:MAG: hypothetical protein Q9208_000986 [Pyrenodesmia sp. 3 TL-2023]